MARPDLEHAHPSGAVAGTFRPVDHAVVDVLMDDGTWGHAEAIGWAQDISRDWRIQLLYYDAGSQREDWWMYDPQRVRLAPDADPPAGQLARPAQRLALAPLRSAQGAPDPTRSPASGTPSASRRVLPGVGHGLIASCEISQDPFSGN